MEYEGKTISDTEAIELLKQDIMNLSEIKDISEAVQTWAVKKDWANIDMIPEPTEAIQFLAVGMDPEALEYIEDPSEDVQSAAVSNSGLVIEYIEDPSDSVQLQAVEQNPDAVQFIENPSAEVEMYLNKDTILTEDEFENIDLYLIYTYMKKNGLDEISVEDLKSKFGASNIIKQLLAATNGQAVTEDDVLELDKTIITEYQPTVKDLLKNSKVKIIPRDGVQQIFKPMKNLVMVIAVPLSKVEDEDLLDYANSTKHPKVPGHLSLVWLRFTYFKEEDTLWIDEVQSDLDRLADLSLDTKELYNLVVKKFIQYGRSKLGANTFYWPTHKMKRELYKANPPSSVYKKLPKKFRFKKTNFDEDFGPDRINEQLQDQEVWKLVANKGTSMEKIIAGLEGNGQFVMAEKLRRYSF